MPVLRLSEEEVHVLDCALEFYAYMGIGRLSEVAQRLKLLLMSRKNVDLIAQSLNDAEEKLYADTGKWTIADPEVSEYTLTALILQARLHKLTDLEATLKEHLKLRK